MKIIHIVDYLMPQMGYQEFLLPKWNARHGHEVHIVTSDRYTPFNNYSEIWEDFLGPRICGTGVKEHQGVVVHRLPGLFETRKRIWIKGLAAYVKKLKPDVVFCHGAESFTSIRIALGNRKNKFPLFIDDHMIMKKDANGLIHSTGYFFIRLAVALASRRVSRYLGVATECCEFLVNIDRVPASKVGLLPLGVDTEMFKFNKDARTYYRKMYGIPDNGIVVMQTGKLTADKSPEWLASAMGVLMAKNKDLWLVYIGSGPNEVLENIRKPLAEEGVDNRMKIIPFVKIDELASMYSMGDICVYPNAASLSCLEAAACEAAVIMSDYPASIERAKSGAGICYKTGDIGDLSGRISGIIENGGIRSIGIKARQSIVRNLSYDQIAFKAEKMMEDAILSTNS